MMCPPRTRSAIADSKVDDNDAACLASATPVARRVAPSAERQGDEEGVAVEQQHRGDDLWWPFTLSRAKS